jgi:nondiscriminating aspartyl-tRNA synthetase
MDMAEYVIKEIFAKVKHECSEELEMYSATLPKVPKKIPRIKMREAQEIIFKRTKRDNRKEPDLEPEDEREICKWALKEHGSELIFITHYPTDKRPFYTYPDPDDPEYTYSFDLLGRGLEWVTGGQRIHDYNQLVENIKKWKLKPEEFETYLQAFKYGMPPEGGFALGAERITMQILGLKNVREASLFPRDMERVDVRLSSIQKKGKK